MINDPLHFRGGADFFSTSSIPHFGHFPGLSLITSGCMVQVYTLSTFFLHQGHPALGTITGFIGHDFRMHGTGIYIFRCSV